MLEEVYGTRNILWISLDHASRVAYVLEYVMWMGGLCKCLYSTPRTYHFSAVFDMEIIETSLGGIGGRRQGRRRVALGLQVVDGVQSAFRRLRGRLLGRQDRGRNGSACRGACRGTHAKARKHLRRKQRTDKIMWRSDRLT